MMLSILMTLATIIVCALVIGFIVVWRLKPQDSPELEGLRQRAINEEHKVRTLQGKLDEAQSHLNMNVAEVATAQAKLEAAERRAEEASQNFKHKESEFSRLQQMYNDVSPKLERAGAERASAVREKEDFEQRFIKVSGEYANLLASYQVATSGEASAKSQVVSLLEKAKSQEIAIDDLNSKVAKSQNEAVTKFDALMARYNDALERATTAETQMDGLRTRIFAKEQTISDLQWKLNAKDHALAEALAKTEADEAAANRFEKISKGLLETTVEGAKKRIEELTLGLQKTSDAELEKHAVSVAKSLEPLFQKLKDYDEAVESLKKNSQETYGGLREQLNSLQISERNLHEQAKALTTALSASPKLKGTYGELMLKQLVEFVGMQEYCHFDTQVGSDTAEGRKIPDMVVKLPGGQKLVIDAKAVMSAYLDALQAEEESQKRLHLKKHCTNVRVRIDELSQKNYFENHKNAVEAVVLFLPAENLYGAVIENDADLTEYAIKRNIIICGPNALIMLLKVTNQLWRRASIEEESQKIVNLGQDIYKHVLNFCTKYTAVGDRITSLTKAYNEGMGTLNGRLIPAGGRMGEFKSIGVSELIEEGSSVRENVREFSSPAAKLALSAGNLQLSASDRYATD